MLSSKNKNGVNLKKFLATSHVVFTFFWQKYPVQNALKTPCFEKTGSK